MKKLALLLIALLATACLAPIASADIIWIPEDDFYMAHQDECYYSGQYYYTAEGLILQVSPQNGRVVDKLTAGEELYCQVTYTDSNGTLWGMAQRGNDTAWFKLNHAALKYNNDMFISEHGTEIEDYDKSGLSFSNNTALYYTYPNSGEFISGEATEETYFSQSYTDSQGKLWGYVSYYHLYEGWVCLDDPKNENLDSNRAPIPNLPAVTEEPSESISPLVLVIMLVVGLAALTFILIFVIFWRKRTVKTDVKNN